jgi:hypothetical protein
MGRFGKILAMIAWLRHLLGWLIGVFRSRQDRFGANGSGPDNPHIGVMLLS